LGQGDSALAHVQRALTAAQVAHASDDSLVGSLYFREGQAHRVREDFPAAIRAFDEARERMVRRFGFEGIALANVANELGRGYTHRSEYDSARVELERAVAIAERNVAKTPARLEMALTSLATFERRAGDPGRGVELATRAYELNVARSGESGPQAYD